MATRQDKFNKKNSMKIFISKCMELFFTREEVGCLGTMLGMKHANTDKDSIAEVLRSLLTETCEK